MRTITTIGLDIAKSVFQVHGVDAAGQVVNRRQIKRRYVLAFFQKLPPCLVGIEACASSHHWSRELKALGHRVRLMPPGYVKPYVKRQKNDASDAEAICEAVGCRRLSRSSSSTLPKLACMNSILSISGRSSAAIASVTLKVKFNDFEIITRSRSVPVAVSSRSDLERLSIALLQNEMPLPKPVRLLGVSLSSLQGGEQDESQLGLPI